MYFNQFPKIFYDFPQDVTSTQLQILTDITTNVRIRKEVLENITIYDEYDIQEGETPEIIAEKIYGDPELHWIIMLANQRYDYLADFPMTSHELDEYCIEIYGTDHINDIHHYERNGIITEGVAVIKLPNDSAALLEAIRVHDYIINENGRARIESIDSVNKTINILLDYGSFSSGELLTVQGARLDSATGIVSITAIINFVIPTNGYQLNDNYIAITNYIFEIRANEKKRRIKLISRDLVTQIVREFKSLVKPV